MKRKQILPRGFKTRAEEKSLEIRNQLGLKPTHACPARLVAELHDISVTSNAALIQSLPLLVDEFPDGAIQRQQLESLYSATSGFSAVVAIVREHKMILYNEQHSPGRQESDLMHEIAHVIQGHPGDDLKLNSDISLRAHDEQYEEEAIWLGSVLQIPEVGLMWFAKNRFSMEQIAERYNASLEMVRFRWGKCGVTQRLKRIGI